MHVTYWHAFRFFPNWFAGSCSYGHLLVITGFFYGINTHSILMGFSIRTYNWYNSGLDCEGGLLKDQTTSGIIIPSSFPKTLEQHKKNLACFVFLMAIMIILTWSIMVYVFFVTELYGNLICLPGNQVYDGL